MTQAEKFLEFAQPDETGWTKVIYTDELYKKYPELESRNGCQFARNTSAVAKKYNVVRFHANEMGGKGNKVVAIQLQGFRKDKPENHSIPNEVRKALQNRPCVVLGVIASEMEIDHKNGKYTTEEYTIDDFQPMSKAANDAKREHCKRCNATKKRFKASVLGYNIDFYQGDENSCDCIGCFWYDPIQFRKSLMK